MSVSFGTIQPRSILRLQRQADRFQRVVEQNSHALPEEVAVSLKKTTAYSLNLPTDLLDLHDDLRANHHALPKPPRSFWSWCFKSPEKKVQKSLHGMLKKVDAAIKTHGNLQPVSTAPDHPPIVEKVNIHDLETAQQNGKVDHQSEAYFSLLQKDRAHFRQHPEDAPQSLDANHWDVREIHTTQDAQNSLIARARKQSPRS